VPGGNNSSSSSSTSAPAKDPLNPHGQHWVPTGGINVDAHAGHQTPKFHFVGLSHSAAVRPVEYFQLMFPMEDWPSIVEATNAQLLKMHKKETNSAELLKYLGIRLVMTVEGARCSIDEYWATNASCRFSTARPQAYGDRFNMSRTRFKDLSAGFRLTKFDDADLDAVSLVLHL
jgi:hypothetical protein